MNPVLRSATAALVVSVAGCRTFLPAPSAPRAVVSVSSDAEGAAVDTWVATGDAGAASEQLDRVLARDPGSARAWFTKYFIAREALDELAVVEAAGNLLRRAPSSPQAEVVAARLQELARISPAADRLIESALTQYLDSPRRGSGYGAFRARASLLAVQEGRQDDVASGATRSAMGLIGGWSILGPLRPSRLGALAPIDPRPAFLPEAVSGPLGPVVPRFFIEPSGVVSLASDPWDADGYEAWSDVVVPDSGPYLLMLSGLSSAEVWIDGQRVLVPEPSRSTHRPRERSWASVRLEEGHHLVRVMFARVDGSSFMLALARQDGAPSLVASSPVRPGMPIHLGRVETRSRPPDAAEVMVAMARSHPDLPSLAWEAALACAVDDLDGARRLLQSVRAPTDLAVWRALRIDLTSSNAELSKPLQAAAVGRELNAILAVRPDAQRALLLSFERERASRHVEEAARTLERLSSLATTGPQRARAHVLRARLAQDRGDYAGARRASDAALELDTGRCDAASLRFKLARRDDELAVADRMAPILAHCSGADADLVSFWRARGRIEVARSLIEAAIARSPSSSAPREALAELLVAQGASKEAEAALLPLESLWPRAIGPLLRRARIAEFANEPERARSLRLKAWRIDASDVTLARAVSIDRGEELLDWAARDGVTAAKAHVASRFKTDAAAVLVLDLAAGQWLPDGSLLERTHTLVQVLDKQAIDRFGELATPPGAQVLLARTIKRDGRVIDAELLQGKESISLPDLEPGDFAEHEFIRVRDRRSAAIPGFQTAPFYFDGQELPVIESGYRLRVPRGFHVDFDSMGFDTHPAPVQRGDALEWTFARPAGEPLVREPLGPAIGELVPWVEAGSGAGTTESMSAFAQSLLLRSRPTAAIDAFVAGLDRSLSLRWQVAELVGRVGEVVASDEESNGLGFLETPETILAGGRGHRLVLLKSALDACSIPSSFVLARPFDANPHPFRFPHPELYSALLLTIEPDGGAPIWIDFSFRHAPVGVIPGELSGADAFVLQVPAVPIRLPETDPGQDRSEDVFDVTLLADGTLAGSLTRTATGYAAAKLRALAERVGSVELVKVIAGLVGQTLRGAEVAEVRVEPIDDSHTRLLCTFRVPRLSTARGPVPSLPASFALSNLDRELLGLGTRRTPLLVDRDLSSTTHATLTLPSGVTWAPPPATNLEGSFGRHVSGWRPEGDAWILDESTLIRRARIVPSDYGRFRDFVSGIERARSGLIPLVFGK